MRNRPRILQIITKADVGGAQQHVLQILRELCDQIEFVLLTGEDDYLARQARALDVVVEICPQLVRPIRPLQDIQASVALFKAIQRLQPDLVHLHSFKAGLLGRLAARLASRRSLFTAHGWSFTPGVTAPRRMLGLLLERIFCRVGDAVVTISRHDYELAEALSVGRDKKRYLVLNAADDLCCAERTGKPITQLVTVGRLTQVKNQSMLLDVMRHLPPSMELNIVGEGVERPRLEKKCQEMGLSERVHLRGEVTELRGILGSADMFLLSSDFEGLPLSVLEAMSAGLPVIATDVGGVKEAVLHGKTGLLVQRRNVRQFADCVMTLAEDPERAREMGRKGRDRFANKFTVARFIAEMDAVYRELLPASSRKYTETRS